MSLLRDEQGSWSTARCAFWLALLETLTLVALDAFGKVEMSVAAYSLLGTIVIALAAWAGGPRMAQYLAPQLGAVAAAIGRGAAEIRRRRQVGADDQTEPT